MSNDLGDFELRRPPHVDPSLAEAITNSIQTDPQGLEGIKQHYGADEVDAVINNNPLLQEVIDPAPGGDDAA